MADILIKNIKIPKNGTLTLVIHPNHDVYLGTVVKDVKIGTAIELPKHGRLGDLDALVESLWCEQEDVYAEQIIKSAPTIVEANE